jgi:hypothetical protein
MDHLMKNTLPGFNDDGSPHSDDDIIQVTRGHIGQVLEMAAQCTEQLEQIASLQSQLTETKELNKIYLHQMVALQERVQAK